MKYLDMITCALLIIGGLNWGLVGLFGLNIFSFVLGGTGVDTTIYLLFGLAAIWQCSGFKRCWSS